MLSSLFTMTDLLSNPVFWIVMTAVSEIIGMNKKLKDNSIVELIRTQMALKPKRLEVGSTLLGHCPPP